MAAMRYGVRRTTFAVKYVSQVILAEPVGSKSNLWHGKLLAASRRNNPCTYHGVRHCSNDATTLTFLKPSSDVLTWKVTDPSIPYVPEPPAFPVDVPEALNALGESTFASQGLGGWSPVGLVENCFEFIHVTAGVPWWLSIVAGTIIIRFALFPVFVLSQRNSAKMNNVMPQMQALQLKMTQARNSGNALLTARYSHELMIMMKEKGISPFKNMLGPLCQAPVFISFFMALREMANLPLESMKTGGAFWFVNLTIPDPIYMLPLITSATLFATLEIGAEGGMDAKNYQWMRYVLRAIPIVVFPFTLNFPAAVLCYWATSNFVSLGMVALMKIPAIRQFCKIPVRVKHDADDLPMKPKKFKESFQDAMTNNRIARELSDRQRIDEIRFRKAGMGPVPKTYPYDPTKQHPSAKAAHAKGREEK